MENNEYHAIAELWKLIFGCHKTSSLKCALDLGIADAIFNHGQPMTLSQLHSALSLPPSRKPSLFRLMRILTHFGFILEQGTSSEVVYDLTPLSRLVTTAKVGSFNLLPYAQLQTVDDLMQKSYLCMGDWFRQEEKKMPFELAHGANIWEIMSHQNPEISKFFNDAMASSSCLFTNAIVKYGGDIFNGTESLVDVGGGTGAIAKVIAENFPHVECTVLDLPHVEGDFPNDGNVKFVAGDMFKYIPAADVVLLKWILHGWSDEDCIKILRRCKEAIPSRAGGKVLILEAVVGSTSAMISKEPQLLFDLMMMTATEGAERDEQQWSKLFTEAGFSSYNIMHTIGFMSIIELYP